MRSVRVTLQLRRYSLNRAHFRAILAVGFLSTTNALGRLTAMGASLDDLKLGSRATKNTGDDRFVASCFALEVQTE